MPNIRLEPDPPLIEGFARARSKVTGEETLNGVSSVGEGGAVEADTERNKISQNHFLPMNAARAKERIALVYQVQKRAHTERNPKRTLPSRPPQEHSQTPWRKAGLPALIGRSSVRFMHEDFLAHHCRPGALVQTDPAIH